MLFRLPEKAKNRIGSLKTRFPKIKISRNTKHENPSPNRHGAEFR